MPPIALERVRRKLAGEGGCHGKREFRSLACGSPQNVTVRSNPMALVMVKLPALSTCRTR